MRILTAAILALLVLVACRGEGGEPANEEDLRSAAVKEVNAIIHDDRMAAYRILARVCRDRVSYPEYAAQIALARTQVQELTGISLDDIRVTSVEVRNLSNEAAEALVRTESKKDPDLPISNEEFTKWVYEDGSWHTTDCGD